MFGRFIEGYFARNPRIIEHFDSMQLSLEKAYEKYFTLNWDIEEIETKLNKIIANVDLSYHCALLVKYEKGQELNGNKMGKKIADTKRK